jgi:hypothetical protein
MSAMRDKADCRCKMMMVGSRPRTDFQVSLLSGNQNWITKCRFLPTSDIEWLVLRQV